MQVLKKVVAVCIFFICTSQGYIDAAQEKKDTALHDAAAENNVHDVRYFLRALPWLINIKNKSGLSALSVALLKNNFQAAAEILTHEDVHISVHDYYMLRGPFLTWLITQDNSRCFRKLACAGIIDSDKVYNDGSTPLHLAVQYYATSIIKFLLQEQHVNCNRQIVHVDSTNKFGRPDFTALHCAVIQQNEEVIQLLLDAGADTTVQDSCKRTPYFYGTPRIKMILDVSVYQIDTQVKDFYDNFVYEWLIKQAPDLAEKFGQWDLSLRKINADFLQDIISKKITQFASDQGRIKIKDFIDTFFSVRWLEDVKLQLEQTILPEYQKKIIAQESQYNEVTQSVDDQVDFIVTSYPHLASWFTMLDIDFRAFISTKITGRDWGRLTYCETDNMHTTVLDTVISQIEAKIFQELRSEVVQERVCTILHDVIDGKVHIKDIKDPIFRALVDYKTGPYPAVMRSILAECIGRGTTRTSEFDPVDYENELLEKILTKSISMFEYNHYRYKKFELLKLLVVDTGVVTTEPVLYYAHDPKVLRFLMDNGAKDIESLDSGDIGYLEHTRETWRAHLTEFVRDRVEIPWLPEKFKAGQIARAQEEIERKCAQDDRVFKAKKTNKDKLNSYVKSRYIEEFFLNVKSDVKEKLITIGFISGVLGVAVSCYYENK